MRRNGGGRLRLSILDHTPVSSGSTLGDAFWHSTKLAELAEQVGYERYWVAEHHNMPWLASSSPAVLVAHVAARTTKLRVGSGGITIVPRAGAVRLGGFLLSHRGLPIHCGGGAARARPAHPSG